MKHSLIADDVFRRAFIVALFIGILCRGLVLRVTNRQYPSRPQDFLEQIIISGLAASLGAIAFPALIDKEFFLQYFFNILLLFNTLKYSITSLYSSRMLLYGLGLCIIWYG